MRTKVFSFIIMLIALFVGVTILYAFIATADTAMAKNNKVTLCHKPNEQCQTKNVPQEAVAGHLGHGDYTGPCKCSPPVEDPVETEEPSETETPNVTEEPNPNGNGSSGDSDVAAITRFASETFHIGDIWLTTYWVGDAGKFRICGPDNKKHCWKLPMPTDIMAVTLSENRGSLDLSSVKLPGTYWLYAHHWLSGNTGNDGKKLTVYK